MLITSVPNASLISKAKNTAFGKDHDFKNIVSYNDFKDRVKVTDYEGLRAYVDRIVAGESDVLWIGKPSYFSKTSGTTSGVKYIPLTKESIPTHINSARNALLSYVHETGKSEFLDKKVVLSFIVAASSPVCETELCNPAL